jgi:Protein of unknown function (DUF3039)
VATSTWFNELVTEFIGDTNTLLDERTEQQTDAGDHDRFSHYVRKEKIVESAVTGAPVIALCGKVWTPTRDPQKFPICTECKEIYESLPTKGGQSSE